MGYGLPQAPAEAKNLIHLGSVPKCLLLGTVRQFIAIYPAFATRLELSFPSSIFPLRGRGAISIC